MFFNKKNFEDDKKKLSIKYIFCVKSKFYYKNVKIIENSWFFQVF